MELSIQFQNFLNQQLSSADKKSIMARQKAFEFYSTNGLPTRKNEEWRYLDLKEIKSTTWQMPNLKDGEPSAAAKENILTLLKAEPASYKIVFLNGILKQELSDLDLLEKEGCKLDKAMNYEEEETLFSDSFQAWNYSSANQPIYLSLRENSVVTKPILFVFITDGLRQWVMQPFVRCQINKGARVEILEHHCSLNESASYLTNSSVSINQCENSKITYCRIQSGSLNSFDIGRTQLTIGKNATCTSLCVGVGSKLSRHELICDIRGSESLLTANGIYKLGGTQTLDNHTVINHHVGGSSSTQLYKGLLDGNSKGIFNGKVVIAAQAQGANSQQLNKNLILSHGAEVYTKPEMDIYADDVKATHGATTGRLNEEELFYLLARAIPEDLAKKMLMTGFLEDVCSPLGNKALSEWVMKSVGGF